MQTRAFNKVVVNNSLNYITKSSCNVEKLKDEVNYYLNLPEELSDLFPQLISFSEDFSRYTLKYFPYNNLANLFLDSAISLEEGRFIVNKLISIADKIHSVKKVKIHGKISEFYIQKTIERFLQTEKISSLNKITQPDFITINGKEYANFRRLKKSFIERITDFTENCFSTIIHGDFCLSNILYSSQHKIIKLIDPRGSFHRQGIYGDKHYDFAKLMHCFHGKYDHIVNNQFQLEELAPFTFNFTIFSNYLLKNLHHYYSNLLVDWGISLPFIYLIEASLFLSMVPLHYENSLRQKAFYLNGIMILNDVINEL